MDWTPFLELVPGFGTLALAVLSGAGGSALLELIWKPRRDRRAAATLIYAELLQNAQMILFHAEMRKARPRKIPADFRLSTKAWEVAATRVGELPVDLLKKVLLLYNHFEESNRLVEQYSETLDRLEPLSKDDPERKRLEKFLNSIIDVFNTGLDRAFELSKEVGEQVVRVARIKEKDTGPKDYAAVAREHAAAREERIRLLDEMQ